MNAKARTIVGLLAVVLASPLSQAQTADNRQHAPLGRGGELQPVAPALGILPPPDDPALRDPEPLPAAAIDGDRHHLDRRRIGRADTPLLRMMPAEYADGLAAMPGVERTNPRLISNRVHAQPEPRPNPYGYSDMLWQWGQFLDHDVSLTEAVDPPEAADIPVPAGDPVFDPQGTGEVRIAFLRSVYDHESGVDTPRQQMNQITAWIDASNVYGSDVERARALRRLDGSGKLKTSDGNLLPFNVDGLPNAGGERPDLFLAGDIRANEQAGLTAMHTLFVREHNRLAEQIAAEQPQLDDEGIYQAARRIVMAQMQVITYREFLPRLLGPDALPPYRGYRPRANASIRTEFSTAAYRLGHTLLSPILLRLDAQGNEIGAGHLSLADAFFNPVRILNEGGIEPLLRGLTAQVCQQVDVYVVDEVRNFLFGLPGSGGLDLASLNIQRGRDHGLPGYNDARVASGREPAIDYADISADADVQERLAATYASPDDIDLWTGGLAEDHVPGALVGPLFHHILTEQFAALRDGDRYWYQRVLTREERATVEATTLADIIRRNTSIGDEIPDDVFVASSG